MPKKKTPCAICAELEPHLTGDTESGFPAVLERLAAVSRENYRNAKLLRCPECGRIYEYRQWTPGGSEDAMVTYVHESLRSMGAFAALLWFADSIAEAQAVAAQGYEWFGKLAAELGEDERRLWAANPPNPQEVVKDGKLFLEKRHFEKVHEYYRKTAFEQHQRAEKIVEKFR